MRLRIKSSKKSDIKIIQNKEIIMGLDYKNAGVDIEAGYKSVELMKAHVKETMRPEVLGGLGGFSGAFSITIAE